MTDQGSRERVRDTHALDARLLRYRAEPGAEDPIPLCEALIAAGRTREARQVAKDAVRPGLNEARLLVLQGRSWLAERDHMRAQAVLLQAARTDPTHAPAYRWLGETLLKRGDPERAERALSRACGLDPADGECAELLRRAGRLAQIARASNPPPAAAQAAASEPRPDLEPTSVGRFAPPPASAHPSITRASDASAAELGPAARHSEPGRQPTGAGARRPPSAGSPSQDDVSRETTRGRVHPDDKPQTPEMLSEPNPDPLTADEREVWSSAPPTQVYTPPPVRVPAAAPAPQPPAAPQEQPTAGLPTAATTLTSQGPPGPARAGAVALPTHPGTDTVVQLEAKALFKRRSRVGRLVAWFGLATTLVALGYWVWLQRRALLPTTETRDPVVAGTAPGQDSRSSLALGTHTAQEPRAAISPELREATQALEDAQELRAQGQIADALSALERALEHDGSGGGPGAAALATEAHELAQAASEHHALDSAQRAAEIALHFEPGAASQQLLAADILVRRGFGQRARQVLAGRSDAEPGVAILRARAALLHATPGELRTRLSALRAYREQHRSQDPTLHALELRLQLAARKRAAGTGKPALLRRARELKGRHGNNHDAAVAHLTAALALGRLEPAERTLDELLGSASFDPDVEYLRARAHLARAQPNEAEQSLKRALELAPAHPQARTALGALWLDHGRYREAYELYSSAPEPASALSRGAVDALIGLGRFAEAKTLLARLGRQQDERPPGREAGQLELAKARLELAGGTPRKAIDILTAVVRSSRRTPAALALLGDALFESGKLDQAAELYERALDMDATSAEALLGRARTYVRARSGRRALGLLKRAEVQLERRAYAASLTARLLALRAEVYVRNNRVKDATRTLDRLLRPPLVVHAPPAAYFLLGEVLVATKNPEARSAYKKYLKRAPRGRFARRARRALVPRGR